MRSPLIAFTAFSLLGQAVQGQVVQSPVPSDFVAWPCNNGLPVYPHTVRINYELVNTRATSTEPGLFRLWYTPSHHLAAGTPAAQKWGTYQSSDVDVEEMYGDMGVWVMDPNALKTSWVADCYRRAGVHTYHLVATNILGRLTRVEAPDCDNIEWVLASVAPVGAPTEDQVVNLAEGCNENTGGSGGSQADPLSGVTGDARAVLERFISTGECTAGWIIFIDSVKVCDGGEN